MALRSAALTLAVAAYASIVSAHADPHQGDHPLTVVLQPKHVPHATMPQPTTIEPSSYGYEGCDSYDCNYSGDYDNYDYTPEEHHHENKLEHQEHQPHHPHKVEYGGEYEHGYGYGYGESKYEYGGYGNENKDHHEDHGHHGDKNDEEKPCEEKQEGYDHEGKYHQHPALRKGNYDQSSLRDNDGYGPKGNEHEQVIESHADKE